MIQRILDRLLDWLLSRCEHDPRNVTADITEGMLDYPNGGMSAHGLQWCNRCGAHRFTGDAQYKGAWRRPRPMWCEPYNTEAMIRDAKAQP